MSQNFVFQVLPINLQFVVVELVNMFIGYKTSENIGMEPNFGIKSIVFQ